jgi:hypothetical protein
MATEGIEAVFRETRNWGKAAKFFDAQLAQFSTDHNSGQLRSRTAYLFIAEVPEDKAPACRSC